MNILFLSRLSNNVFAGPNYSVPAGVKAQQRYDNCLWVNLTDAYLQHWSDVEAYHNIREYCEKGFVLNNLPEPFNLPDIVVFEGFYNDGIADPLLAKALKRKGIPYIIVPRGSLTKQAMNNHSRLKKRIAHFLFYDNYCKNALAIQYLTNQEYEDSFKLWNERHLIIPNGFDEPSKKKTTFSSGGIKMVFIGRPDKYHKGIDVLWEALRDMRDELRQANVSLDFYAPKGKYDYDLLNGQVESFGLGEVVTMHDKISGTEKEEALLASDLFVMTSRFEGHPMGLIEALAYGLPVLVTPGTNMAQEVLQSNAGWVAKCDVAGIRETLQTVISEKGEMHLKGQNAMVLASNYRWDTIAKEFHNQVDSLLH